MLQLRNVPGHCVAMSLPWLFGWLCKASKPIAKDPSEHVPLQRKMITCQVILYIWFLIFYNHFILYAFDSKLHMNNPSKKNISMKLFGCVDLIFRSSNLSMFSHQKVYWQPFLLASFVCTMETLGFASPIFNGSFRQIMCRRCFWVQEQPGDLPNAKGL